MEEFAFVLTHIALCDGDGKAAEYDGLALSLVTDVMSIVMLTIVTI